MHPEFPHWYHDVAMGGDKDELEKRWHGVSGLMATANLSDVDTMLRIVFARSDIAADAMLRFRKPFVDADAYFGTSDNNREMVVLAGSALACLMDAGDARAPFVALALTTSALGGARTNLVPFDLIGRAEHTIAVQADQARRRPSLSATPASASKLQGDIAKTVAKYQPADQNSIQAVLAEMATVTASYLQRLETNVHDTFKSAMAFITIQDEELQMLWWVVNQWSREFACSFRDLPISARPIIVATALAELTNVIPGPTSADGLLAHAGLGTDPKLTVPEAINACDGAWLKRIFDRSSYSFLATPLHFAIVRKLESGDDSSWVPAWATTARIDPSLDMTPLALGRLLYRERLLCRLLERTQ